MKRDKTWIFTSLGNGTYTAVSQNNFHGRLQFLITHLLCTCSSATNRLITSKDHASVQINIGHLDKDGIYVRGDFTTFALCGFVRAQVFSIPYLHIFVLACVLAYICFSVTHPTTNDIIILSEWFNASL